MAQKGPSSSAAPNNLSAELTFDEMLRARQVFIRHTEEYVTTPFELRTILSELGQYPQDAELSFCVEAFGNKLSFNNFTTYLSFLKRRFMKPEPQDGDTLRAFVALGGGADRRGDINAENLRSACRQFDLTIDIDAMIREVDDDNSGKLEFGEFKSMWTADAESHHHIITEKPGEELEIDETMLSGTIRSPSAAERARRAAQQKEKEEEEQPEPEEDTIDLLKQHLFPNSTSKKSETGRKAAAKRASLVQNQPKQLMAPALRETKEVTNVEVRSDSDSDEAETPQAFLRNQYKPPSPVILSMRNVKPPTKTKNLLSSTQNTPRGGAAKPSPRASPRSTVKA